MSAHTAGPSVCGKCGAMLPPDEANSDLLEACKAALEAIKFLGRTCNDGTNGPCGLCTPCRINKAVPLIKAAIAKATGEAPR